MNMNEISEEEVRSFERLHNALKAREQEQAGERTFAEEYAAKVERDHEAKVTARYASQIGLVNKTDAPEQPLEQPLMRCTIERLEAHLDTMADMNCTLSIMIDGTLGFVPNLAMDPQPERGEPATSKGRVFGLLDAIENERQVMARAIARLNAEL